ncbi:hypothetical protein BpHYR1_009425 [Brachionus plicatilis]|uniref:Uncharacterized protein n=1 Tax=Brachionus plicatilis TaxID=10195 RepID=A0A3M7R5Z1_BRAPC|nr:hypothetical protein BpHYR1_009425 [Brachionus plicatilis]
MAAITTSRPFRQNTTFDKLIYENPSNSYSNKSDCHNYTMEYDDLVLPLHIFRSFQNIDFRQLCDIGIAHLKK